MKVFLRFVPMLAGIAACGIVGVIGVMFSMNDDSGIVVKIAGVAALVVGFVVLQVVKGWLDKRESQAPK